MPDEIFEDKGLINWFHIQLYQIPAQEFLQIMGDVISSDESKNRRATARFKEIMREAQELKSEYDNWKEENGEDQSDDDNSGNNDDDDGDDDLDDFLSGLGISMPK
jgi:hypothetical protein